MLRILWYCSDCGAEGQLETEDEIKEMCGACPKCLHHKGNVEYSCGMKTSDFLNELSNMTEKQMQDYYLAITECARDLANQ